MLLESVPYSSEIKKEDYLYLFQENQKTQRENEALKAQIECLRCQLYQKDEEIAALETQQLTRSRRAQAIEIQQIATQRLRMDEKIQALVDRVAALEKRLPRERCDKQQKFIRMQLESYQTMQNLIESQRTRISELEN